MQDPRREARVGAADANVGSVFPNKRMNREETRRQRPSSSPSLRGADSDLSVALHQRRRSCHPIWPEVAAAGPQKTGHPGEGGGPHTHTHTQWWTRTHTQASIHECLYKHTHTHRYTPVCTFLPHSAITQMLVTAVTGGKEEGGCTNSGLCNAADIELCAFLFGKSTQTMKGQLTAARRLSQFLVFKQNVNSDQERVELVSRHSLFFFASTIFLVACCR